MTTKQTTNGSKWVIGVVVDNPDGGSEDRILGVFDTPSAARTERARLNKVRAARVEAQRLELLADPNPKMIYGPRGGQPKYRRHDEESAKRYAGYDIPRIYFLQVPANRVAEADACVFRMLYEKIEGCPHEFD